VPVYRKHLDQIIAGTQVDGHGEKRTKEFFEKMLSSYPQKMPLNQQHDMRKETLGYLENFRLIPSVNETDEWNVIADIYITSDDIDNALKGFSFSALETIGGNTTTPLYYVHLPFPLYNDEEFIETLINSDDDLMVGKWIKKAIDPTTIGLVATGIALFFGPEWDIQYKSRVRPAMNKLLSHIPKLIEKDVSPDLIQHVVGYLDERIKVYFVPDRSDVVASYQEHYILPALCMVRDFLEIDEKSKITGLEMAKLFFDKQKDSYVLFHIQYLDGTDVHVA
jgi:hypothetical protein